MSTLLFFALVACTPESPSTNTDKGGADSDPTGSGAAPQLTVAPPFVIFGGIEVGGGLASPLELQSTGDAPVTITEILAPAAPFSLGGSLALPLTLAPGETAEISVAYEPTEAGSFTGVVGFVSDDPEGVDEVIVEGTATVVTRPVAVCSVSPSPIEPILEPATWSGEGSYDPNGLEISDYDWELVSVPDGSNATMPTGDSEREGFLADIPGTFVAQLVVTNEAGQRSDPCEVSLESATAFALWIEMHWTEPNDDMDLHLVRPAGELETDTDCYYANCLGAALDWGVPDDPVDDPELITDDVEHTGPEVIRVFTPEAGDFEVYVQDYNGSNYLGANPVTVNIYINGVLSWTDVRDFSDQEGHYENFASVSFPSGVVTAR